MSEIAPATATLSGTLHVGEANPAMRDLQFRLQGSMWWPYLGLIALMIGFVVTGWYVVNLIAPGEGWGALAGAIVAALIYRQYSRRFFVSRFRDRHASRGHPLDVPMLIDIGPAALVSEVGDVKIVAQWPCVTDLFCSHGYWIFIAQASAIFAPKRLFASVEEQRAFVAAALSHMSEASRERSAYAAAFAAGKS